MQNEPEGSGFVDSDFYWTPDYSQAGTYTDITFTVSDGTLDSDPQTAAITVANVNDAPVFIATPAKITSYSVYTDAKSVGARGDYVYAAYANGKLKALDISNIKDIREVSAINTYRNPARLEISDSEIYLVDSGNYVYIVDIAIPSSFYALGNMQETAALNTAVYDNTAYIACGENIALYDITDRNYPSKLEGYDLGKADKVLTKDEYAYAISADEDLKVIDTATNEVIAFKNFNGSSSYEPVDIAISGNNIYIAKDTYGIICFDVQTPESPSENGEFYIADTAIKELKPYNKDRIFALGASSNIYSLIYIDTNDPTLMTQLWSYSFGSGSVVDAIDSYGNMVLAANQNGVDIIVAPLDDSYTVEAESELKITIYVEDPDADNISYTMENKPDFAEAEFSDRGDGRATFTWTPTEDQIGNYADISFVADDGYQEVSSKSITINVVSKEVASQFPPVLLLHLNTDLSDSSPSAHTITKYGNASIDSSVTKLGAASVKLDGSGDYLSAADSDDWYLGSGDFTIDCWVRFSDVSVYNEIYSQVVNGDNRVEFYRGSEGCLSFYDRVSGVTQAQYDWRFPASVNTWYHIALVRSGSNLYCFINGTSIAPNISTAIESRDLGNIAQPVCIGARPGWADKIYLNGWIDEFRISKGIARWTRNFTPPKIEY